MSCYHAFGAIPKPLHLDEAKGFSFAGADLAPLLSPRTKLIYLCSPSNPTGGVASPAQLQEIADVIRTRCGPDVRVYADEVYEDILFDGSQHHSIASCPGMADRTILVSGPTGSGKSSTLAGLIQEINLAETLHVVTIESPIEYTFRPRRAYIRQREVGRDIDTVQQGLEGALREDPDIILVGEMRDVETIMLAMVAAETGHLVLGTLHSLSATAAVD